jgi:hypothetical protein
MMVKENLNFESGRSSESNIDLIASQHLLVLGFERTTSSVLDRLILLDSEKQDVISVVPKDPPVRYYRIRHRDHGYGGLVWSWSENAPGVQTGTATQCRENPS